MSTATDQPSRKAGKRGLRRESHAPELMLSKFMTSEPNPPPTGDVTQGRTEWGVDHNDTFSCCGPAATDHGRMVKIGPTAQPDQLGGVGVLPLYWKYGLAIGEQGPSQAPNQPDEGVENRTWLQFLFELGVIDGFVELDKTNMAECHQALLDFRGLLVAVSLTDDAEQLFEQHQPWTTAQGEQPDQNEGHDIYWVKYGPEGDTFITWGEDQLSTIGWDQACILEVWAFLMKEDAARAGINLPALQEEIRGWGGITKAEDRSLLQRLGHDLEKGAERVVDDIRGVFARPAVGLA